MMYRTLLTACSLLWLPSVSLPAPLVTSAPVPGALIETELPGGARGLYGVPVSGWNGDLVVFAHGYASITEPLDFENLVFADVSLPELAQQLGYAFATTTYRQTGLTVLEGIEDIRQLALRFPTATGVLPRRVILIGVSEGGIVSVLAAEKYPRLFNGVLSLCGPVGNFRFQANYIAGMRALFDCFFPGILPGNAVDVPPSMLGSWYDTHLPAILQAIRADPARAIQLLDVLGAAYVPGDFASVEETYRSVLWYHTFGTTDAVMKLGGNPYDNRFRRYRGSSNDGDLNRNVGRYQADRAALRAMKPYNTKGNATVPIVVMHTTGDELVPFEHALLLAGKAREQGNTRIIVFPVNRYGHCEFTLNELVGGLVYLLREIRE